MLIYCAVTLFWTVWPRVDTHVAQVTPCLSALLLAPEGSWYTRLHANSSILRVSTFLTGGGQVATGTWGELQRLAVRHRNMRQGRYGRMRRGVCALRTALT